MYCRERYVMESKDRTGDIIMGRYDIGDMSDMRYRLYVRRL